MRIIQIVSAIIVSMLLLSCKSITGYPAFILRNTGDSAVEVRAVYNNSLEEVRRIVKENFSENSETLFLGIEESKTVHGEENNPKGKYFAFGLYVPPKIVSYAIFENRPFQYPNYPFSWGGGEWTFIFFQNDKICIDKNINSDKIEEKTAADAREYLIEIYPPLDPP